MNIPIDDPRITAFALGELEGRDAVEIARAVQRDARVRAAVEEIRETSFLLWETLGGGGAPMLTSDQRNRVRSVGGGGVAAGVVADIGSPHKPIWQRPWVTGVGVAAAVALTSILFLNRPGSVHRDGVGGQGVAGADQGENINPVTHPDLSDHLDDSHRLKGVSGNQWKSVTSGKNWLIPTSAHADKSAWEAFRQMVVEKKALPSASSIQIESLINHFQYQAPKMLVSADGAADIEMAPCPWNPKAKLLAVHLQASGKADVAALQATLSFNNQRVKRAKLLGYAGEKSGLVTGASAPAHSEKAGATSSPRSQYVLYELEMDSSSMDDSNDPVVTLHLRDGLSLPISQDNQWAQAGKDLQWATVIAASAMLVTDHSELSDVGVQAIKSLIQSFPTQDADGMSIERKEALTTIQALLDVYERQTR